MKNICILTALCAASLAAENRIPAEAQQVQPYTYAYTDHDGTQWMYRQTPFGLTKWQSSDVPPTTAKEQPNNVTAIDTGDAIRFERTTPFGHYTWTKQKSELTGDEKLLIRIAAEKK